MNTKLIAAAVTCTVVWTTMAATSAIIQKDLTAPTVTSFVIPSIIKSTTVPITTFRGEIIFKQIA